MNSTGVGGIRQVVQELFMDSTNTKMYSALEEIFKSNIKYEYCQNVLDLDASNKLKAKLLNSSKVTQHGTKQHQTQVHHMIYAPKSATITGCYVIEMG